MSGKRYPEEFKIEAVKQVVDRGHPVSSVATRLGITTHSLYCQHREVVAPVQRCRCPLFIVLMSAHYRVIWRTLCR